MKETNLNISLFNFPQKIPPRLFHPLPSLSVFQYYEDQWRVRYLTDGGTCNIKRLHFSILRSKDEEKVMKYVTCTMQVFLLYDKVYEKWRGNWPLSYVLITLFYCILILFSHSGIRPCTFNCFSSKIPPSSPILTGCRVLLNLVRLQSPSFPLKSF